MRAIYMTVFLAACGAKAPPAPPANQATPSDTTAPIDDLVIESTIPKRLFDVTRDPDGAIVVSAPFGADVYFDGVSLGPAPVRVPAPPPGRHVLKIDRAGY